jgi:hypothetical protein
MISDAVPGEAADDVELDDLERLRRRDDAAVPAVRVHHHRPAALALQLLGLLGGVERPDRLRRPVERWVVGGDAHVREHARRRRERAQLCGDERADLGLRLSDGKPEG